MKYFANRANSGTHHFKCCVKLKQIQAQSQVMNVA